MKLAFGSNFVDRVVLVRDLAVKLRSIATEVELGKTKSPGLFKTVSAAREVVEAFPPSELIAFTDNVVAAFTAQRRAQLVHEAVRVKIGLLETEFAALNSALSRSLSEAKTELNRLCVAEGMQSVTKIPGIGCLPTISALERMNEHRGNLLERAEVFISTCAELGLEVKS